MMSSIEIGQFESGDIWQLKARKGRVELFQNHSVQDWTVSIWRIYVYPHEKQAEEWLLCGVLKGTDGDARRWFTQICQLVR